MSDDDLKRPTPLFERQSGRGYWIGNESKWMELNTDMLLYIDQPDGSYDYMIGMHHVGVPQMEGDELQRFSFPIAEDGTLTSSQYYISLRALKERAKNLERQGVYPDVTFEAIDFINRRIAANFHADKTKDVGVVSLDFPHDKASPG